MKYLQQIWDGIFNVLKALGRAFEGFFGFMKRVFDFVGTHFVWITLMALVFFVLWLLYYLVKKIFGANQ